MSDGYQTLPFPFDTDSIGLGSKGSPLKLDMPKDLSFEGFLGMLNSWSAVVPPEVELLAKNVVIQLQHVWGGPNLVRPVVYKTFMLAGKVRPYLRQPERIYTFDDKF
ncbi:hypothetical protein HanHA300_Chr05g0192961 [Helianthus annuus]|nr:hypothetical protein HanHA300_Chr05g0192961 [Helianthus annuus]KAJ0586068.1 hypothetical protein HanHA89_Chr05g0207791 [Helianthus annuus]